MRSLEKRVYNLMSHKVNFKKIAISLVAIIANSMSIYKEDGLTPHVELPVSCIFIDIFLSFFLFDVIEKQTSLIAWQC